MVNRLFWLKLFMAFLVGFLGSLVTFLTGLSEAPNFSFDRAAVISLIAGALAAGIRAVLALGPVNLVPSDNQHTIIGPRA
jgi:hypothetical protein